MGENDYIIQLTDPLNGVFIIKPYSVDGNVKPIANVLHDSAVSSDTSLTLFGKGFPDYGEIHASNMVHILENFTGASEPQTPLQGQLWYLTEIYWHNTDTNEWFVWQEGILSWVALVVIEQSIAPTGNSSNDHWVNTDTDELFIFDGTTNSFVKRYHHDAIVSPTSELPQKIFMVYNGTNWVPLSDNFAADLSSDDIDNDSNVVGVTVTDALNEILSQLNILSSPGAEFDNFAFLHTQTIPSSTWVVTHELNFPIVRVFISGEEVQPLEIIHDSPSQTRIIFSNGETGLARFIGDNALAADSSITGGVSSLGVLTLTKNVGSIVIPNVAPTENPTFTGNVQLSGSTTHLILDHDPESELEAATKQYVDYRVKWIEKPRLVTTSSGGSIFTTPEFIVGFNNLFVYINGKKEYASERGYHDVFMDINIVGNTPTGLTNDTTLFTFNVLFDGVTLESVSVVGQSAQSYTELITEINNDLSLGHAVLLDNSIKIVSNLYAGTSAVVITDTGLFAALTNFDTFGTPFSGFIESYNEIGNYGVTSTSIEFNSPTTLGEKLEFLII